MPHYQLIKLWNLLDSDEISVGLGRFKTQLTDFNCDGSRLAAVLVSACQIYPCLRAYSVL